MGVIVPALNVLVAVLADSSFAVIVGALLAGFWLRAVAEVPGKSPSGGLQRLLTFCLAGLIVCHLVHPWFVASSMSGSTQFARTLALVPTILSSTRQGSLWYTNSVALAVLLAGRFLARTRTASFIAWMEIASLCVIAAARAGSSHASEEGDFTLSEILQFIHLLATAVWAGAIVVSGLLVVPRLSELAGTAGLWSYGHRLSMTVTWALAALVVSGVYTSWRDMHGAIHILWSGSWGKILLMKGVFVGVAALLGSLTRLRCLARPATGETAATMTRLLRSEAIVMMAILCLSGLLGNTNPGS